MIFLISLSSGCLNFVVRLIVQNIWNFVIDDATVPTENGAVS